MSWSLTSLRSAAEDARRRVEAEARAAIDSAQGAARAATERATEAVRTVAEKPPEPSAAITEHATQAARDFVKNAAAKTTAGIPSSSPLPGPLRSPTKTPSLVPGVNHEGSTAEKVRPYVMLGGGFGTGVVSGHLGPGGALAQRGLDAVVDHYGTAQDKFNFGYGQMASALVVAAEGATIAGGGGSVEVGSAGAASPVAIPAVAYGAVEIAVAVSHADGASALMSNGAPSAPPSATTSSAAAPTSTSAPSSAPPSAASATSGQAASTSKPPINIDHVIDGEINAKGRAVGYHWKGSANPNVRTVAGTRTPADARGVYEEQVEIYSPATSKWVAKKQMSTFFPDNYSRADVERSIEEAYANRTVGPNGRWEGTTADGMTIRGYTDASGKITTAFPVREP